jgi:long-chain acyl-CoA synthetase
MYTSGTTGRPKGAMGTHLGIISSNVSFERCMGLRDGDRTLVAVPLFHVTGLIGQFLSMAFVGGTTVIMRTFDAAEAVRLLDAERITYMIAAPTVFTMMRQQPGYRAAGQTLRRVGYGGAPTPPDGIVAMREWLPTATLQNAYGMTETCSPTTVSPPGEELGRISSVGWPVPIADLRTVDVESGRECEAGEVGELWVHGPMVVPGYWANPEATASSMGDGWLRTGDLAKIDADGYVTVMDRLKDMINRGGEKIYCVEVEDVLCAHPAILEAAVVGVPDAMYGEAVKACVVPRPGAAVDPEDVRRWVAARLAKFKVPREVAVADALPRNPNGKVIKSALR